MSESMDDLLPNFPIGPLDVYRDQASFSWKKLKLALEGEDIIKYKESLCNKLQSSPLFAYPTKPLTMEEHRERVTLQTLSFYEEENSLMDPRITVAMMYVLGQYDWSLAIKRILGKDFVINALLGLGTETSFKFLKDFQENKAIGAFCLTEISHGTNARAMRTTATYNSKTQQFILHTPDFEAAKCWAANLAKTANVAIVFAQLYTPDGACHGLHTFVVPIRDSRTMQTYPGITIGDMGSKLGLQGLDNGFMIFDNYPIPRENFLNKLSVVTPDGRYVTSIKDRSKRFGASMGPLSGGRVAITSLAAVSLCKAVPIAIRYSAIRKQFGSGEEEMPIIEYQMQQWRLFPYLAAAIVWRYFSENLFVNFHSYILGIITKSIDPDVVSEMGIEIHGISSVCKPISGWLAQKAIQECRQACGGHGYLSVSGFGDLLRDNDANCTYEGDNNVLLQQCSNWLLSLQSLGPHKIQNSPLGSVNFLQNSKKILQLHWTAKHFNQLLEPEVVFNSYQWLVCYLLETTLNKYKGELAKGSDAFVAKNNIQVYHARSVAIIFGQHYVLSEFWKWCSDPSLDIDVARVLKKVFFLYSLWELEKHCSILYEGGYIKDPTAATLLREANLQLCVDLKPEAVGLADVIAPSDFILNSALGNSDGNVYRNMQSAFFQIPGVTERPSWWKHISQFLNAKL